MRLPALYGSAGSWATILSLVTRPQRRTTSPNTVPATDPPPRPVRETNTPPTTQAAAGALTVNVTIVVPARPMKPDAERHLDLRRRAGARACPAMSSSLAAVTPPVARRAEQRG